MAGFQLKMRSALKFCAVARQRFVTNKPEHDQTKMKPHLEATIADLNDRITQLQTTIKLLQGLDGEPPWCLPATTSNPSASVIQQMPPLLEGDQLQDFNRKAKKLKKAFKRGALQPKDSRSNPIGDKRLAIAAGVAEPFGSAELGQAIRIDTKAAGTILWRWSKKGWLEKRRLWAISPDQNLSRHLPEAARLAQESNWNSIRFSNRAGAGAAGGNARCYTARPG